MKTVFLAAFLATAFVSHAVAGTINYNTTGSSLSCNGVSGCSQNTSTSVTIGGLTLIYNIGSGSGVVIPSIINYGNLALTGTGETVSLSGLLLTINVNSTPPGASGMLPTGSISGTMSTNQSLAVLAFTPNNSTGVFGSLPGVAISGVGESFTYQILQTTLGLQAPTVGNPVGHTSIQGAVVFSSIFANGFEAN